MHRRRSPQSGFAILGIILVFAAFIAVVIVGWYVLQAHKFADWSERLSKQSSSPYHGWKRYENAGDGFSLLYPAPWSITGNTSGIPVKNMLQSISFGPSKTIVVAQIYSAAPNPTNAVIDNFRPGVTQVKRIPTEINGVSANHEITKNDFGRYASYTFWHDSMILYVSMDLVTPKSVFYPQQDNTAFEPEFNLLAHSVCFAENYSTNVCPTNK
jgi:hypothetical protein